MKEFALKHPVVTGLLILALSNTVVGVVDRLVNVGRPIYILNISRSVATEVPNNEPDTTEEE